MKSIVLSLSILLFGASAFSFQAVVDSTLETNTNENNHIKVEGLKFSFKNDIEARTLEIKETGSVTCEWESIDESYKFISLKYRETTGDKWLAIVVPVEEGKIEIKELPENLVYQYYLGAGSSKDNIIYTSELSYFNSIGPGIFKSNQAKSKEEEVKITWGIEKNKLDELVTIYPNAQYLIKYNTKIGKDQNKSDKTKSPWIELEPVSINKVSKTIEELVGGETYVYKIGLDLGSEVIWAKEGKVEVERSWGVFKLLVLIGALGMFIFGMKIMSEGLQKAAGSRLRNMLGSITKNRVSGVLTGFGITSVVQSSSVTTVMTVSFVNAGLMTLRQSAGVMMGANIGTTITAWLILLFGFKVSLGPYALVFIAIGAPLMFFSKGKAKMWASVIIGFALLFLGLDYLKDAVPTLGPESAIVQFFVDFKDVWYGPVMFVFLGALVTIVIQSSSAAMALTMTLVAGGVIPFEVAAAMILGENIGTTITAELASLVGNVHAKRSARIHSLFNIIGVGWAILLFPFILKALTYFIEGDPYTDGDAANIGLALFHSAFNAINVLLLIGFVPQLVRLAERTVKSRGAADEEFRLDYIGTGIMGSPELSIVEAKKEVAKFGEITGRMSVFMQDLLVEQNQKARALIHAKMAKYEEITDRVEIEVANYLAKVSEQELSEDTAKKIRSMNSIANDLERVGDIFYQMSKSVERKNEQKIWFTPEQRANLKELYGLLDNAFEIMVGNLKGDWDRMTLESANEAERQINMKRDEMRDEYLAQLNSVDFNLESGVIYSNLFSLCEKAGDHIINVSEALIGKI